MEDLDYIKKEFQEQKALCLFKVLYGMDNFEIAPYVMSEVAKMFNDTLNKEILSHEDVQSNFDLICAVFSLTDKAIHGDDTAKQIGSIFMEVISIKDIPMNVRTYVTTEMMLSSEKAS